MNCGCRLPYLLPHMDWLRWLDQIKHERILRVGRVVWMLLLALTLGTGAQAQLTPGNFIEIRDEGAFQGKVKVLDCVGAGVACTVSGIIATLTAGGGAGGAPADATYWVGAAHAGLSAEINLGALGTGLVLNTAGTPSIYAGTTCTNQVIRLLDASGAATCVTITSAYVDASLVPSTRSISTVAPLSGGGDLSANRTFTTSMNTARLIGRTTAAAGVMEEITVGAPLTFSALALDFDETATLGNNARVTVRRNTGADVGTRRRLNFIEGTNVTLTVADDAGSEEVDVTINSAGGGPGSANVAEVSLSLGTAMGLYYSTTVTGQAWVTGTSVIVCSMFGTTADGQTPETIAVAGLIPTVSDRVVGTGFNLNVMNPNGATGTIRAHCTGA